MWLWRNEKSFHKKLDGKYFFALFSFFRKVKNRKKSEKITFSKKWKIEKSAKKIVSALFFVIFFHYAKAISLILRIFYLVCMSIFNEIPIYFDEQSVTFWELPKGRMKLSAWNSLKNNYILNFQRKNAFIMTNMVPCQIHWTIYLFFPLHSFK